MNSPTKRKHTWAKHRVVKINKVIRCRGAHRIEITLNVKTWETRKQRGKNR